MQTLFLLLMSVRLFVKFTTYYICQMRTFTDQNRQSPTSHVRDSLREYPQPQPQIEDYKQLYFQAMRRVRQLTSIQEMMQSTKSTINEMEAKDTISEYQIEVKRLSEQLQLRCEENGFLVQEIRKMRQLFGEREQCIRRKMEIDGRRGELVQEELQWVKNQLRLCRKELQNEKQLRQKIERGYCGQDNTDKKKKTNSAHPQQQQTDMLTDNLKTVITKQQQHIFSLQTQVNKLSFNLSQAQKRMQGFEKQIKSRQELCQLELQSKTILVDSLRMDLEKRQRRITELQSILSSTQMNYQSSNDKRTHYLEKQLQTKARLIQRLTSQLQNTQQLLSHSEYQQQQIFQQLTQKDIQLQQLYQGQKLHIEKINFLHQAIEELKADYIHAELQKTEIYQKLKKQQKELKISRFHNLSLSKISHSTLQTTSTPLASLKNSKVKLDNSIIEKLSVQTNNCSKSQKTQKNTIEGLKKSFYKNKLSNGMNVRASRITPFQL